MNQHGVYFLAAKTKDVPDLSFYRIDRITSMDIDEPGSAGDAFNACAKQIEEVESAFISNNISLYPSEKKSIKLRVPNDYIDPVLDDFPSARLQKNSDSSVTAVFKASERAMLSWALKHRHFLEVLEPESLRNNLYEAACAIKELYKPQDA